MIEVYHDDSGAAHKQQKLGHWQVSGPDSTGFLGNLRLRFQVGCPLAARARARATALSGNARRGGRLLPCCGAGWADYCRFT
jgi:hypothetical protein